jgi:hypothetical protein
LLSDATHLCAVVLVGGEAAHLVSHSRAQPATSGGFTESNAHSL